MTRLPPAILLGVDTPIGLTVIRELGSRGVPVHGVGRTPHAIGRASRWLASFSVRPSGAPGDWLPGLIRARGAAALLAISEDDLIALAALPPVIEGCRILTPRAGPLAIVLDKQRTLAVAESLGIDTPRGWQPVDAGEPPPGMGWPVVAKWADPIAVAPLLAAHAIPLVKAEYCADAGALARLLARYAAIGRYPLVQEYCGGRGIGQMFHVEQNEITLRFQHERLHEWPPEGGVSTLCRAVPLAEHAGQRARSEALLAAIGWQGPAMVEYRWNPATGAYKLMEINGRFWGSQPLAWHCGAHFGWELYRRGVLDVAPAEAGAARERAPASLGGLRRGDGVRTDLRARFMIPETRRLVRILLRPGAIPDPAFRPRRLRDLARWLLGFLDPRMRYYVFSPSDPGPFLADIGGVIRRLTRRGSHAPD